MKKNKKLIIFGAGKLGYLAYEYFKYDSEYEIECFTTESKYIKKGQTFCDLPMFAFENIETIYPPSEYEMYIALGWYKLNRNRTYFYNKAKEKGYKLATYISSSAFVWHNVEIGDNCMIMENCVLHPFSKIGNNVTLWSSCCIQHYSYVKDNCSLVARCVVAGNSEIGENSFLGVNVSVGDTLTVAPDNFIAMGSVIRKSTMPNSVYEGNPAKRNRLISAKQFQKVEE